MGNGLASFDPQQRKFRMLASAAAVNARSPLDGGNGYLLEQLTADPANHCLWLNTSHS